MRKSPPTASITRKVAMPWEVGAYSHMKSYVAREWSYRMRTLDARELLRYFLKDVECRQWSAGAWAHVSPRTSTPKSKQHIEI